MGAWASSQTNVLYAATEATVRYPSTSQVFAGTPDVHRSPATRPARVSTTPPVSSWYAVVVNVSAGSWTRGWRNDPTAQQPAEATIRTDGHSGKPGTERPPSSSTARPAKPAST